MATTPDADVRDHLDTNVAALTTGTNLFNSKLRAVGDGIPVEAVFCMASGGPPPEAYLQGGVGDEARFSAVSCFIRSENRDFSGGQDLARTVRDALHHQDISGYHDVRASETEPIYVGEDDDGNHNWTANFELWHEE